MATKAKLEGNARYLAKKKTVTIRFDPDEHKLIQSFADKYTNGSFQGYVLEACREKMKRDKLIQQDDNIEL